MNRRRMGLCAICEVFFLCSRLFYHYRFEALALHFGVKTGTFGENGTLFPNGT